MKGGLEDLDFPYCSICAAIERPRLTTNIVLPYATAHGRTYDSMDVVGIIAMWRDVGTGTGGEARGGRGKEGRDEGLTKSLAGELADVVKAAAV